MAGQQVGSISIKVTPNTKLFREELQTELEWCESNLKIEIPLELDPNGIREKVKAELAGLDQRVNVKLDVDKTLGSRLAGLTNGNGIGNFGKDITALSGAAESAGLSVSRMGLIISAVFVAAAPAVALVAGLLAGLPSLISAFGAAATTVLLGMDGIKKAAADTGLFNVDKKGNPSLGAGFDEIKKKTSEVFENGLKPAFQQIVDMLPALTAGFQSVAGGLSTMFQGFTSAISGAGLSNIQNILTQTGSFFAGLAPIVNTATQSFLTLSSAGASAFNLLLAPLQNFATGFDNMVNRITSNGSFQTAMQGLSVTLDSVLNLFTRLFESGVTAMGQLGGPLTTLINGLGDAFIAMMPALTSFSGLIANVLGTALTALAPSITALTPAFTQLSTTLGTLLTNNLQSLAPILTQISSAIGTSLTTALATIQPMLPGLVTSFQNFANAISAQLPTLLPQIATAFGTLAGALLQIGPTVLQTLANAFVQLAPSMTTIAPLIPQIATAFTNFLTAITPLIPQIVTLAVNALLLGPAFLNLAPAALNLAGAFLGMLPAIGSAIGILASLASPLASVGVNFDDVKGKVIEFGTTVVTKSAEVIATIAALPGKIAGLAGSFGGALVGAGKALMDGLLSGIKAGLASVLSFAAGIAAKIAAVKGPISHDKTVLTPNGQALMQGLQDGIEGGFQGVLDRARLLAGEISDAINSGGPISLDLQDKLKKQMAEISLENKDLKLQFDNTPKEDKTGRKANQDQRSQLQTLRDQLSLQSDQLGFSNKYGDSLTENDKSQKTMSDTLTKMVDIGKNFAMANVNQFESDLGISGNGAIPTLANIGLDWASGLLGKAITGGLGGGTHIQVNSIDEALAAKQNIANKQALQFTP